jgi:hypothetical protein
VQNSEWPIPVFSRQVLFLFFRRQPTGEAFIEMEGLRDIDLALRRHKDKMGGRWDDCGRNFFKGSEKLRLRYGTGKEKNVKENTFLAKFCGPRSS